MVRETGVQSYVESYQRLKNGTWRALLDYKVSTKGKVEQSREGLAPFPTPRCSSDWKGSLPVTLD